MNREAIETSAQHAADCVNEKSISSGIRWIIVGDYVDKIARYCKLPRTGTTCFDNNADSRWAMQDPGKAVLFLTSCLKFESKLEVCIHNYLIGDQDNFFAIR